MTYSYTEPAIGEKHSSSLSATPTPKGAKTVSDVHTHGAYDEDFYGNKFSGVQNTREQNMKSQKGDIGAYNKNKMDGYLATPAGMLLKYKHKTGEVKVINKMLPSDPNDPQRINKVSPLHQYPVQSGVNPSFLDEVERLIKNAIELTQNS